MIILKTISRTLLTYNTWIKYLRTVKGITHRKGIRDNDMRIELEVKALIELIEEKQLSWWIFLLSTLRIVPLIYIYVYVYIYLRLLVTIIISWHFRFFFLLKVRALRFIISIVIWYFNCKCEKTEGDEKCRYTHADWE